MLLLELQAGLSRAFGERADPPVVLEPGTVEHDTLDTGGPGTLGDERAHLPGAFGLGAPWLRGAAASVEEALAMVWPAASSMTWA